MPFPALTPEQLRALLLNGAARPDATSVARKPLYRPTVKPIGREESTLNQIETNSHRTGNRVVDATLNHLGERARSLSEPAQKIDNEGLVNLVASIDLPESRWPLRPKKIPTGEKFSAPLDAGKNPRLLNLDKLNLSSEAEAKLRSVLPAEGEKTHITHEAQKDLARQMETVPEEIKRVLPQDWSPAHHLAASNIVSENMERIVNLSKKVSDLSVPLEERDAAHADINRLTHDVMELTGGISKSRETAGRRLNALKILANKSMEPSTWLVQAQRAKGVPLSTEEMAKVHEYVKGNDRQSLVQFINKLYTPHPLDQALGIWKAGLLTNPVTHVVNNVSNAGMAAMETIKEPVALAADRLISLVRNERGEDGLLRKTKAPSIAGLFTEPAKALPQGFKLGADVFKRTLKGVPDLTEKYDFKNVNYDNWFGGSMWNAYTRTVFGSLSAEDKVFNAMNLARTLEEQIRLQAPTIAKARGVAEKDVPALIKDLRKNPTDDMMLRAIEEASVATFQNPNKAAEVWSTAKGKVGPKVRGTMDFVAPFTKTPANVTARLLDYSPLGLMRTFKIFKSELSIPEQKKLAEDLGRSVTGSSLVALGFMLAREGKATGAMPGSVANEGSQDERAMWDEKNKQANSVKVGNKWLNISRISPPGMLIALGAQMYNAAANSESIPGKAVGAVASVARVAADQPFLTGPANLLEVANDPARAGEKYAEQAIGSVVPAGIAAVARGLDDTVRDPKGIKEVVESRLPGLSKNVGERLTPFGEVVKREGGLSSLVNPIPFRTENDDPLLAEMERLGLAPRVAGKTYKSHGVTVKRTPEEQREFQRSYGYWQRRNIGKALSLPQLTTDEDKQKEADKALGAAYHNARRDTYHVGNPQLAEALKKRKKR